MLAAIPSASACIGSVRMEPSANALASLWVDLEIGGHHALKAPRMGMTLPLTGVEHEFAHASISFRCFSNITPRTEMLQFLPGCRHGADKSSKPIA
jgi:hypothetical protein